VTIAKKNFLKIFYGFFTVKTESKVQVREMERLASWATRYTLVLRQMSPFTGVLYGSIQGFLNRDIYIDISSHAKLSIWMWRVVLCLLNLNELAFARSFSSFTPRTAEYMIGYDAAVGDGIGVSILEIKGGSEKLLGIGRVKFPYSLENNPRYQNLAEFTAVIVGCISLARKGVYGANIRLVGDNKTSLKWGKTERFKGVLSRCASIVYVLLCIKYDFQVVESVHIAGADNGLHDRLSRGVYPEDMGYRPQETLELESDSCVVGLLNLCDPNIQIEDYSQLITFWKKVNECLSMIAMDG
jgi:hypothetical protein